MSLYSRALMKFPFGSLNYQTLATSGRLFRPSSVTNLLWPERDTEGLHPNYTVHYHMRQWIRRAAECFCLREITCYHLVNVWSDITGWHKTYRNWVRVNKSERHAICSESLTWLKIHGNYVHGDRESVTHTSFLLFWRPVSSAFKNTGNPSPPCTYDEHCSRFDSRLYACCHLTGYL
jgi:hypothetical protein